MTPPPQEAVSGDTLPGWSPDQVILVIDVVDSVGLLSRHGPGSIHDLRQLVDTIRQDLLPKHGGRLVKSTGDGVLALFDGVQNALEVAQAARQRADSLSRTRDADAALRLRMAVHRGTAWVDDLDALGDDVNVAFRLAASAEPGELLLTAAAADHLHPSLDLPLEDLGDRWLKHLAEPLRVHRALDEVARQSVESLPWCQGPDDVLRPTLAILPFECAGGANPLNPGELVTDELICALSQLPDVNVVSHLSTAFAVRRRPAADGGPAAQSLGADYVVSGRCHVVGDQLVIHAELIDSHRQQVIERFRVAGSTAALAADDSPLIGPLLQGILSRVLDQQVTLAQRCALPNAAGYTLLLGGITLMHRLSRRDFQRARHLLEHLCERWPRLAAPHAWRARWHLFSVIQGWSDQPALDRRLADEACRRALDLDDASSVALAVAGSVRIQLAQDVDGGLDLYELAVTHNPNDSLAWTLMGTAHAFKGEGRPALQAARQARRLSPLDPMHFLYDCHAASAALAAEDATSAVALAERSLRSNAQHLSSYRVLAIAQMLQGDGDAARRTVRRLRLLDPGYSVQQFLKHSPSSQYEIGRRFAKLLGEAGLPETPGEPQSR